MNFSIRSEDSDLDNFFSSLTEPPILDLEGREETRTGTVSFLSARSIKNSTKVPGLAIKSGVNNDHPDPKFRYFQF